MAAGGSGAAAPTAASHAAHHRCGWLGSDTAAEGLATFAAHPDYFDAVHPTWFGLLADGTLHSIPFTDDPQVLAIAHAHHVQVIPLVNGDNSTAELRGILSTPESIAHHAQVLVDTAVAHNYDGLDLDYEHLWTAADRPGYMALVTAVAQGLHAHGKVLTLAVPAMDSDLKNAAYDYAAMSAAGADVLHLMGYDYHYLGGDHLGPIAPRGWIDGVARHAAAAGVAGKSILAVANYGIGAGWYTNASDALARCIAGSYSSSTTHMQSCSYGAPEAGVAPHCNTDKGEIWFEDAGSVAEKVGIAAANGLRGIGYWTMGNEVPGFFDAVSAKF